MICYIGIGSNLGDRLANTQGALHRLSEVPGVKTKRTSPVYETQPWPGSQVSEGRDVSQQRSYYNLVVEVETALDPKRLLDELKQIEHRLGRCPSRVRWQAREVDLDILLFGSQVIRDQDIQIPHPLMQQRSFVLKPLSDLAPDLRHPVLGKEIKVLLETLGETGSYKKV